MMTIDHLDEGTLQALLDEEIAADEAKLRRGHLASCPDCRGRFADLSEANHRLAYALAALDPTLPHSPPLRAAPRMARPPVWRRVGAFRAAATLVLFAAAASATVPGSPVRRWLGLESTQAALVDRQPVEPGAPAAIAAAAPMGVSVPLTAGAFDVQLTRPAAGTRVRVRLVDADRGGVYAIGPAADARFATAQGRIEVAGFESGELLIEVPRAASTATIAIDGEITVVKSGDLLSTPGAGLTATEELQIQVEP